MSDRVIQEIPLSRIRWQDRTYCFRFHLQTEGLAQSLNKHGLLALPGVVPRGRHYQILYGFRRLFAARTLHLTTLSAVVYSRGIAPEQIAELITVDNHWPTIQVVEKASFFNLIQRLTPLPDRDFINHYSATLGIPPSLKFLELLKAIYRLPVSIKQALYRGEITLDKLESLLILNRPDRLAVFNKELHIQTEMSKSTFAQVIEMLREIKVRNHTTIQSILDRREINDILAHRKINKPQKGNRLMEALRKLRYPHLTASLERVEHIKRQLLAGLPRSARIIIPPYLEGETITICLQAPSQPALENAVNRLQEHIRKNRWQDLFRVIQGNAGE